MEPLKINTTLDYEITCTEFIAPTPSDGTVVISSATGVKQAYYFNFAKFLQQNSINVYTFDYSGIGDSLNSSIKHTNTSASNWGRIDLAAMIRFVKGKHTKQPLTLLAHSIGGQLVGFAPAAYLIDNLILIGAQSGYWKFWKGFESYKMLANWAILIPAMTNKFGYLPSRTFTFMENLPKGMALEWSSWCKSPNYFYDHIPTNQLSFDKFNLPITAYSAEDDHYAPKEAVDWLAGIFVNSKVTRKHIYPNDLNQERIGHFGYFKEKLRDTFWQMLLKDIM